MSLYVVFVLVAMLCAELQSAKILVLHPLHGGSHKVSYFNTFSNHFYQGHNGSNIELNFSDSVGSIDQRASTQGAYRDNS